MLDAGKADLEGREVFGSFGLVAGFRKGSCGGYIREVHRSAELMGGVVSVDTVGPTLRGAARRRTLQEGLMWPLSISGHSGDTLGHSGDTLVLGLANDIHTWVGQCLGTLLRHHAGDGVVWLVSHAAGWSDRSGHFGDTMRWVREVITGRLPTVGATVRDGCARRLGCSASLGVKPLSTLGRSDDTRVRVVGSHIFLAGRAARDALRYHVVGVQVVGGQVRVGTPTVGTLRRYHPSGSVCLMTGWSQHIVGAVALLGRFDDTMVSGRLIALHTGAGLCRSRVSCGQIGLGGRVGATVRDGMCPEVGLLGVGVRPLSTLGRSGDTRVHVTVSHMHLAGRMFGTLRRCQGQMWRSPRLFLSSSAVVTMAQESRGVLWSSTWSIVGVWVWSRHNERVRGHVSLETEGHSHIGCDVDRCTAGRLVLWF